mmetsp:Transcript_13361/g.27266  ORF Transcript_13361/g.27266 Transcript_13361/m.27266 type:complete len:209 (-) Transcript_13361:65-691(-)
MDSIIGVKYSGGVVIAADSNNARSILVYQHNLDKIAKIAPNAILGLSGPNADLVTFSEYIAKNLKLYELSNPGQDLSTKAIASFCRNELATALRRGPYQVQTLLGGWDAVPSSETGEGTLFFLDYMGSMQSVNYGIQGYASNFALSVLDREWKEGLTKEQAIEIVDHCINVLDTRFLISQPTFCIKSVSNEGVKVEREVVAKYGVERN